jgi:hypothetical protein
MSEYEKNEEETEIEERNEFDLENENDDMYSEESLETLENFGEHEASLKSELEESQQFLEEQKEEEEKPTPLIELSNETTLKFRNYNLQVILADKNVENLELKKNILAREKNDVVKEIESLKKDIGLEHGINPEEYYFDLPNNRIIHKSLLQK